MDDELLKKLTRRRREKQRAYLRAMKKMNGGSLKPPLLAPPIRLEKRGS